MHGYGPVSLLLAFLAAVVIAVQTLRLGRQRGIAQTYRAASDREEGRRAAANARSLRAAHGEEAAYRLLERAGYEVLDRQVPGSWTVRADGEALTFGLRADYLVARAGRHYIAEVKTGRLAPRLSHGPTRRQLLEYGAAFDVHGVILVDADAQRMTHVDMDVLDGRRVRDGARDGGEGTWRTTVVVAFLSFLMGLLAGAVVLK